VENSQVIALVALAISLVAIGFAVGLQIKFQSVIKTVDNNLNNESLEIGSLTTKLNNDEQLIKSQTDTIDTLTKQQNASQSEINILQTNASNSENQINSLEKRISSLEQKLQQNCPIPEGCLPPIPQKPVYFPGVVKFYNAAGGDGVTENRVFKQLPSTLSSIDWTADFDYNFTASSIPAAYPLALTSSNADPEQQGATGSEILVYHGDNSDIFHLRAYTNSTNIDVPSLYTGIAISPNTQYYVRLAKNPTELTLSVFSDSARTIQIPGSPLVLAILPTDFTNLKFIQHAASLSSGPGRTLTAEVDNMKIFVIDSFGNRQTFVEDNYSSNEGWTQIGSSVAVNGTFIPPQMPEIYPYGISLR
jgi:hypothetical protein